MKNLIYYFTLLFLILILINCNKNTGVSGNIIDSEMLTPISGVEISGYEANANSNEQGDYFIEIKYGLQEVSFKKEGYKDVVKDILIDEDEIAILDVQMEKLIPNLVVTPTSYSGNYNAGNFNVSITSNSSWTVESDKTWCNISPKSGNGNGTITINYDQNNDLAVRSANITILVNNLEPIIIVLTQNKQNIANNPSFASSITNPYGITATIGYATPSFVDIDNDNDFDLFVGGYNGNIFYFKNTGTQTNPSYSSYQTNPFGIVATIGYATPSFVDIDNDNDFDLFVGGYNGNIFYFKNTGTQTNPSYSSYQTNPFGIVATIGYAAPCLVDIDSDNDFDLFVGGYNGNVFYFKNTGTQSSPSFSSYQTNPFGIVATIGYAAPYFVDIDSDNDFDLFVGGYNGNVFYFKNTGTQSSPSFSTYQTNPFGITSTIGYATPTFIDINNDNDFDLFVGGYNGSIFYFQNNNF